jgi:LemA protein
MSKFLKSLAGIAAGFLLMSSLSGCGTYNRIVSLHENMDAAWSQVENVLQRRYDLIPNLVNTVKGYAKHEANVLEEVTRLRSQWGAAKTPEQKIGASQQLEGALGRLMLVTENYPALRANESFLRLQDELAGTENRIAVERRRYNDAVQEYNQNVRKFPANMIAKHFGYERADRYFKAEEASRTAPKVSFE